jgi:hypothetical protein
VLRAKRFDQLVEDQRYAVRLRRLVIARGSESKSGLRFTALDQFVPVQRKKFVQHPYFPIVGSSPIHAV